ncbi:hypothetical protein ACX1C1_07775 [Paenibacillus sp. strain BS8-2]
MKNLCKHKVATGIVALIIALTASMGVAYADLDVAGTLQAWFNKKTDSAITSLEQSMQSDLETQKEELKQQLQTRLATSSSELDAYTETIREQYIDAIQAHSAKLLESTTFDREEDRQQIEQKLQAILDSATGAMNSLMESYIPPAAVFTPTELQPAPINTPEASNLPTATADAIVILETVEEELLLPSPTALPIESLLPTEETTYSPSATPSPVS